MSDMRKLFKSVLFEATANKNLSRYVKHYSDLLSELDNLNEYFNSDYVYDEKLEPIVEQINKTRQEHAKLVSMLKTATKGQ